MIEQFAQGFAMALRVDTFIMVSIGLFSGMLIGALPPSVHARHRCSNRHHV